MYPYRRWPVFTEAYKAFEKMEARDTTESEAELDAVSPAESSTVSDAKDDEASISPLGSTGKRKANVTDLSSPERQEKKIKHSPVISISKLNTQGSGKKRPCVPASGSRIKNRTDTTSTDEHTMKEPKSLKEYLAEEVQSIVAQKEDITQLTADTSTACASTIRSSQAVASPKRPVNAAGGSKEKKERKNKETKRESNGGTIISGYETDSLSDNTKSAPVRVLILKNLISETRESLKELKDIYTTEVRDRLMSTLLEAIENLRKLGDAHIQVIQ